MKLIEDHYYLEIKQRFIGHSDIEYQLLDITDINTIYKPISTEDKEKFIIILNSEMEECNLMRKLINSGHIHTEFSIEQCVILNYSGYRLYMELINNIVALKQVHRDLTEFKIDVPDSWALLEQYKKIQNKVNMLGGRYDSYSIYNNELQLEVNWKDRKHIAIIRKLISIADRTRLTISSISLIEYLVDIGNIMEIRLADSSNASIISIDEFRIPGKELCIINIYSSTLLNCHRLKITNDTWLNLDDRVTNCQFNLGSIEGSKHIKCLKSIHLIFRDTLDSLDLRGIEHNSMLRDVEFKNINYIILNKHTLAREDYFIHNSNITFTNVRVILSSNEEIDTTIRNKPELVYYNKSYEKDLKEFEESHLNKIYNRIATPEERKKFQL